MKKKVITLLLSFLVIASIIIGYFSVNENEHREKYVIANDKTESDMVIKNDALKTYYGNFLGGDNPHSIEYENMVTFTDTANSLILYKKYNIDFDYDIAFKNAQSLFNNQWKKFKTETTVSSDSDLIDQQLHMTYEYILLARDLNREITNEEKNEILNFYTNYISKEINKEYINKNVELLIKDRLSYISNFLSENEIINDNFIETNDKLKSIILDDFVVIKTNLQTIEDYMNILYAISGLEALQYEENLLEKNNLTNTFLQFITSAEFNSYSYYEQAIFLNKFVSVYPEGVLPELKMKVNNIFQSFQEDNQILANTLKYVCFDLFYISGVGYDESKYYLEQFNHDKNYGFYQPKNMIPTIENIYLSYQIAKTLGIDSDLVPMYLDEIEGNLSLDQEMQSYREMYYFNLLIKINDNGNTLFQKIHSKNVDLAKDYLDNNEINEGNFIHYYYAAKVVLESGDIEFVENYFDYLHPFVSESKDKYHDTPEISYIDALYEDIMSYSSNYNANQVELSDRISNLKDNQFYLDTINIYLGIVDRKDLSLPHEDQIVIDNRIKSYQTKTGFSPEKDMKYTTLSATYQGLSISSWLKYN